MPPKAKAKVIMRRPARAPRGGLRRPGAAVEPEKEADEKIELLKDVEVNKLHLLGRILLKKAIYYHKEIDVVGVAKGVRVDGEAVFLEIEATGTQDEGLLRAATSREDRRLWVHLCGADCGNALTGEHLIHGREFLRVARGDVPWHSNLEKAETALAGEEDELARIREAQRRALGEADKGVTVTPKEAEKAKKEKKAKLKEKSEKERKRKQQDESQPRSEDELEVGEVRLSVMYRNTGLDPDPKRRRKIIKKARRLGRASKKRKKKKKSDSSSASSGSTSKGSSSPDSETGEGLFDTEKRVKVVWEKCPGALTGNMLLEARRHLVTTSGTVWQLEKEKLPPLMTHYVRQNLTPILNPPMGQEALTLSMCIDTLLQGKPSSACDILTQRLKSLEHIARGSHWSIGRQLELIRADGLTITEEAESVEAAKRAREEERLRQSLSRGTGPRGGESNYAGKGKKGKDWKTSGKGKSDEGPKGKGGERGKEDPPRAAWQKRDK